MTDALFTGIVTTGLGLITLALAALEWDAMKKRSRHRVLMHRTGPVALCVFFGAPPLFVATGIALILLETFL